MVQEKRTASPVEWAFAPDWLMDEQACYLLGWDAVSMQEIMDMGALICTTTG